MALDQSVLLAHWCVDYSKMGFLQAVFQTPRPHSFFWDHGSAAKTTQAIREFEIRAVHVPGFSNRYADVISRWESIEPARHNDFLEHARHAKLQDVYVHDDMFHFDNLF